MELERSSENFTYHFPNDMAMALHMSNKNDHFIAQSLYIHFVNNLSTHHVIILLLYIIRCSSVGNIFNEIVFVTKYVTKYVLFFSKEFQIMWKAYQ